MTFWPSLWATHLASLFSNRIRYMKTPSECDSVSRGVKRDGNTREQQVLFKN
nr:MAG TPA: hypothetical protein [Caudoviricetes sp.]